VKHRIISPSMILFNVNKKNAFVTIGKDSFLTRACSGYISDVLVRPQDPAQAKADFQYTAWEHNPHLITCNLYPPVRCHRKPQGKNPAPLRRRYRNPRYRLKRGRGGCQENFLQRRLPGCRNGRA
jgi:hypothetical protein